MVLFLVGMLFHLYLNWKPLFSYLKDKTRTFSLLTKEFLIALSINILFVLGTLYYWTPFEQFLDFEDEVKSSWEKKAKKSPYGHAELSTLEEFAQKTGMNVEKIVEKQFTIEFDYGVMNDVMKIFKDEKLPQIDPQFDLRCSIKTRIRLNDSEKIESTLLKIEGLKIK